MIPVWIVIGKVASVPGCVDRSGRYQVAGLSADRAAIEIAVGFSHKYLHKPFPGTLSQSPAPAGRRARWQPRVGGGGGLSGWAWYTGGGALEGGGVAVTERLSSTWTSREQEL